MCDLLRMVIVSVLLSLLLVGKVHPQAAGNEVKLLALVIGNSAYADRPLGGPANDAVDMAKALTSIGFTVTNSKRSDLTMEEMIAALVDFEKRADDNTVAVVYYSGHGLEDENKNYLVPVDAKVQSFADIRRNLISLDWIIERLDKRRVPTKIVILDACRNMPLSLRYKDLGEKGGLAQLTELSDGTRVVYAASPGKVSYAALSGERNSVFTGALLKAIDEKITTFDGILARAAHLTRQSTGNRQYPWSAGNLGMSFGYDLKAQNNPLMQNVQKTVPSLSKVVDAEILKKPCKEISEQVFENGVATWRKVCA